MTAQETQRYIGQHEKEIAVQRARITPTCATSTFYLASQRIKSCEEAIRRLRERQAARAE